MQTSSSEEDKFNEAGVLMPSVHATPHSLDGTAPSDRDLKSRAPRESQRNIDPSKLTASQKAVKQGGLLLPFQPVVLTFKVCLLPYLLQRCMADRQEAQRSMAMPFCIFSCCQCCSK